MKWMRHAYNVVRKAKLKWKLGRQKRKLYDYIKMDLEKQNMRVWTALTWFKLGSS